MGFKAFLLAEFWPEISFVEAAEGKSERKIDGVGREVGDIRSSP